MCFNTWPIDLEYWHLQVLHRKLHGYTFGQISSHCGLRSLALSISLLIFVPVKAPPSTWLFIPFYSKVSLSITLFSTLPTDNPDRKTLKAWLPYNVNLYDRKAYLSKFTKISPWFTELFIYFETWSTIVGWRSYHNICRVSTDYLDRNTLKDWLPFHINLYGSFQSFPITVISG